MKKMSLFSVGKVKNTVVTKIREKSGASMLFVMAAALLLLIIGASTLVAAGANAGAGTNRQIKDQLDLYAESMQSSVLKSLQDGTADVGKIFTSTTNAPATLGGQILAPIYNQNKSTLAKEPQQYTGEAPVQITFEPTINGVQGVNFEDVIIDVEPVVAIKKEYTEKETVFNADGTIQSVKQVLYPREVVINALVNVTVVATYKEKSLKSIISYNLSGAALTNEKKADGTWNTVVMAIENSGDWGFVSHEKIDK